MSNDKRLAHEFVVHDYDYEDHGDENEGMQRDSVAPEGKSDVLVHEARRGSWPASALRSISSRLRRAVSATTADNVIAHAAESAAASAESLAQTIDEDGPRGIGAKTVDFVKSNSKSVAATTAGLGLVAVEAWRRGGRRSRK